MPTNPILLIPGFMGSQLDRIKYHSLVWIDPVWAISQIHDFLDDLELRTPVDPVAPSGIVHDESIGDLVRRFSHPMPPGLLKVEVPGVTWAEQPDPLPLI